MFKSSVPQSIEDYLAQIEHQLRDLPASARAEEMREIESHLRAMIEQRGDVAAAIAQFGSARKVGRDLRRAWERKQPESWGRMGVALLLGLIILTAATLIRAQFSYFEMPSAIEDDEAAMAFLRMLLYNSGIVCLVFIILGYTTKVISPKRGTLALLLIFAMLTANVITRNFSDKESLPSLIMALPLTWLLMSVPVSIAAHFGARHGRRWFSRAADAK